MSHSRIIDRNCSLESRRFDPFTVERFRVRPDNKDRRTVGEGKRTIVVGRKETSLDGVGVEGNGVLSPPPGIGPVSEVGYGDRYLYPSSYPYTGSGLGTPM